MAAIEDEPENTLPNLLIEAMKSDALQRMHKDRLIVAWRDSLVEALRRMDGTGVVLIQRVIDSIDEYVKRSKSER
jgi:hypothetical protein